MKCKCKVCKTEGEFVESTDLVCLPCYDESVEALEAADLSLRECVGYLLGNGKVPDPTAISLTLSQIKKAITKAKEE